MLFYPNAKINVGLNVVEKRTDGYHNLETVFCPVNLQDALEVHPLDASEAAAGDCQLKVSGQLLDGSPDDNLVVRAFRLLQREFPAQVRPVSVHLYKHIPTGAGLGGGSSDAACMLQLLNEQFQLRLSVAQLEAYAAQLGADCPFFVRNTPVFAQGIGNCFTPIALPQLHDKTLVLVKPDIFVSTRDAYAAVVPQRPARSLPELLGAPLDAWPSTVVNDFEASVFARYPEIAAIKDRLYDLGARYASMSGSGSSVYGIFDTPVEHVDEIFAGYFCRQRQLQ